MPPITKNLGLIKAIHKGINPPINIAMLWYDINPGVNIHKYYDVVTLQWVPLISSSSGATYTFNNTNSIQHVTTGTNVESNVKINASTTNKLQSTLTGLLVEETNTTINSLVLSGTIITLSYTGENGTIQTKSVDISSALIDINVANAVLNPSTYILTITETDGSTHTVNFSSLLQKGNLIFAIGNMNYPRIAPNKFEIIENGTPFNCTDYFKKEYLYSDFISLFYMPGLLRFQTGNKNATIKINEVIIATNSTGIDIISTQLQSIKDLLDRGQDVIIEVTQTDTFTLSLPTPRISYVTSGNSEVDKRLSSDQETWESLIANTTITNQIDYFKKYFDIYFDSFGNNEWKYLPELRVELCMLKHRANNTGWSVTNTKNTSGSSSRSTKKNGLKDRFQKAIIHPRHVPYANRFTPTTNPTQNTIYSGGNGGNHPTEWTFDFDTINSTTTNNPYTNRGKNVNIRLFIDILGFIRTSGNIYYDFPNIVLADPCENVFFKNVGYSKTLQRVRSFRFYFRLSAADPTSWNSIKNRYDKRIYSEYSKCIQIFPKTIAGVNGLKLHKFEIKIT